MSRHKRYLHETYGMELSFSSQYLEIVRDSVFIFSPSAVILCLLACAITYAR